MDTKAYLQALTDEELSTMITEAKKDLEKASQDDPNSEWHQDCFAGFIFLTREAQKRGLYSKTARAK